MNVDKMFAQHAPTPAQEGRMNSLRNCGRMLARHLPAATGFLWFNSPPLS
jgi:hypothetical protein